MNLDDLNSDDTTSKFSDLFEFKEFIGQGAFGVVVSAIDKSNNQECAVKIIPKKRISTKNHHLFKKEAQILSSLNHPNIVKFKDIKETDKRIFLVMELVHDGHLKSLIDERAKEGIGFTELEASTIMKQIFNAVSYMHKVGVIHRDLKPADFGLSAQYGQENGRSYSQQCGTIIYMAPELAFQKIYSKPVDIWSCGIILYILCSKGKHPLYKNNETISTFLEKLKNPKWNFGSNFPKLGRNLFEKLVNQEPYGRYTAEDACKHPWITRKIDDDIPLTANEIWHYYDLEQSLSKIIKALMFLNYMKNHHLKNSLTQSQSYKDMVYNNPDQDSLGIKSEIEPNNVLVEKKNIENIFHLFGNDESKIKTNSTIRRLKRTSTLNFNEQLMNLQLEENNNNNKKSLTANNFNASDSKTEKLKNELIPAMINKGSSSSSIIKKTKCYNSFLPEASIGGGENDSPINRKSKQEREKEIRLLDSKDKMVISNFDPLTDKRVSIINFTRSNGKPPKSKQSAKSILTDRSNKQILPKISNNPPITINESKIIPELNSGIFNNLAISKERLRSSSRNGKSILEKGCLSERSYKPQIADENIFSPYPESKIDIKTYRLENTSCLYKEREKVGYSSYTQSALQKIKIRSDSFKRDSIITTLTDQNMSNNGHNSLGQQLYAFNQYYLSA